MPQENTMAFNDLDSILESELANQPDVQEPSSEGTEQQPEPAPAPAAPAEGSEQNGDTPAGDPAPAPEGGSQEPTGGQNRRPFSRLEKAEYSATKWKKRAKRLADEKDKLQQEFNRYKDLNPAVFRNPQERMQFLAWRASTAQRLNDMDADLQEYASSEAEDIYDEKITQCYSKPESEQNYRRLDNHYNRAFEYMCSQVDPDNVIMDYLKDSPYEPAMRNVIYLNDALQQELFRTYRNPAVGNAKRQQVLERLEARVAAFLNRGRQTQPQPAPQPVQEVPPQGNPAPQPTAQGTIQQPRQPRFSLPQRRPANPAPQPRPQVTGNLTKGGEGAGEPDISAQADGLFKQLYAKV